MTRAVRWWGPVVAILAIGAGACHRPGPATQPPPTPDEVATTGQKGSTMTADPDVVKMLEDRDYQRLFMTMTDQPIDEVWARAGAAGLDAVISDPKASSKARYLAAEIRFRKDPKYRPADPASLARAYADALRTEVL